MRKFLIVAAGVIVTVAVTLTAQTNSQPVAQGRSVCVPFDPAGLQIEAIDGGAWRLMRADGAIFKIFDNREDAVAGLAVAKAHKQLCYIGKSNTRPNRADYIMEYWK